MENDWGMARIEEVAEKVAMGPFGSSIKVATFVPEGVPVISGQHLHGFRVDDSPGFNFITGEHAERLANANVQRGDIVFTHAGNISNVAYVPENSEFERYVVSQRQFYVRCDRAKVIPEFVTAYFKTLAGQHQLLANSSQVGVPSIAQPVSYLRTIEIPLPPLSEQFRIAHILGTLEDKIELNRQMNDTLEQMTRALYKSWFVYFDPVRAKLDGLWRRGESLPGLPAELYDLFPDHLVTSELGEIPDGWTVGVLANMVQLFSGGTPKTSVAEYWNGNIPWYTAKDAPALSDVFAIDTERHISQSGVDNSATQVLPARTTIISARGTVGRLACLGEPMAMNQTCYGIRGIDKYPDWFTYWNVRQAISELQMRTHGTIFDTITRQTFELVDAVVPPPVLAAIFETMVSPYMSRMLASLRDSRRVAYLRDALLPRLVSGKLRVAEPNVTEPV